MITLLLISVQTRLDSATNRVHGQIEDSVRCCASRESKPRKHGLFTVSLDGLSKRETTPSLKAVKDVRAKISQH